MNTISYNYENAKVFKRGRGFLGFTKTIMNDQSTSVKTAITLSGCNKKCGEDSYSDKPQIDAV